MWLWHLMSITLLAPLALTTASFGAPTSLGSTSDREAEALWQKGEAAFEGNLFQEAVPPLTRLIDRYPGKPHHLEAHFYLGKSLYELNQYKKAKEPLNYYIQASKEQDPLSIQARILIGNIQLESKQYQEAYATSIELDRIHSRKKLKSEFRISSLLIKSQALAHLHHLDQAISASESAISLLTSQNPNSLKGKAHAIYLDLKVEKCNFLPVKGNLDESQIQDQLNRRGMCLLEAVNLLHQVLKMGDEASSKSATDKINLEFKSYAQICLHPPNPAPLKKEKRSEVQLKRYREELADLLTQECQKVSSQAIDLLNTWKPSLSNKVTPFTENLSQSLESLFSRKT